MRHLEESAFDETLHGLANGQLIKVFPPVEQYVQTSAVLAVLFQGGSCCSKMFHYACSHRSTSSWPSEHWGADTDFSGVADLKEIIRIVHESGN